MREYNGSEAPRLQRIVCNCCGRSLRMENGRLKEDCVFVDHTFGYFSAKDGVRHRFDLCEDCYDRFLKTFVLPVEESEESELL